VVDFKQLPAAATKLGLTFTVLDARGPDKFGNAFAAMKERNVQALLVGSDPLFILHRTQLAELARRYRLPTMHEFKEFVEAGGLMAYVPSYPDSYRRAASYVDKILKGAKPEELPVEQPTRFELVINLKTAKVLGLTIPQSVLLRADEVIQ
jgi:putative ABC transport system substrate-binding protein